MDELMVKLGREGGWHLGQIIDVQCRVSTEKLAAHFPNPEPSAKALPSFLAPKVDLSPK